MGKPVVAIGELLDPLVDRIYMIAVPVGLKASPVSSHGRC